MKTYSNLFLKEDATEGAVFEEVIIATWNGETPPETKEISPDAGKKVVTYLKAQGLKGKATKLPTKGVDVTKDWSQFWRPDSVPGSTKTPKTDILIGDTRISLKMGAAQLMSGGINESKATYYAAMQSLKSLEDEIIKSTHDKLDNLTRSSIAAGQVDKELKAGKDEFLKKANDTNNEVKKLMKDIFANNADFRRAFVKEAMTGEVKFGKSTKAYAEYVLSADKKGDSVNLHKATDKSFLDKVASKTDVTVRFKSTSVKSKGEKTGQYRYWTVIALGVKKLEEEIEEHRGLMLTEGLLTGIINRIKTFFTELFRKVYEYLKGGIRNVMDFFEIEPEVTHGDVDFSKL